MMVKASSRVMACDDVDEEMLETAESIAQRLPNGWSALIVPDEGDHPFGLLPRAVMETDSNVVQVPTSTMLVAALMIGCHDDDFCESIIRSVMGDEAGPDQRTLN